MMPKRGLNNGLISGDKWADLGLSVVIWVIGDLQRVNEGNKKRHLRRWHLCRVALRLPGLQHL